jgi:hypothetical protein
VEVWATRRLWSSQTTNGVIPRADKIKQSRIRSFNDLSPKRKRVRSIGGKKMIPTYRVVKVKPRKNPEAIRAQERAAEICRDSKTKADREKVINSGSDIAIA